MDHAIEKQVAEYEERLRLAMLQADTTALEELLAPDCVFTNHLGQIISKTEDIESYRSGELMINDLVLSEGFIKPLGSVVTVSVRTRINGYYQAEPVAGDFRFTRIWSSSLSEEQGHRWQVVVAHSSIVA